MSWVRVERRYVGARRVGVPRPFVMVLFEWQVLGFECGVYTPSIEGSLVYAGVDFHLAPNVADLLVILWPGRIAPGERRAAGRRLRAAWTS